MFCSWIWDRVWGLCDTIEFLVFLSSAAEFVWIKIINDSMESCPYEPVHTSAFLLGKSSLPAMAAGMSFMATRARIFRLRLLDIPVLTIRLILFFVGISTSVVIAAVGLFALEDSTAWRYNGCAHARSCFGHGGCILTSLDQAITCTETNITSSFDRTNVTWCGHFFWNLEKQANAGSPSARFKGFPSLQKCRDFWGVESTANRGLAVVITVGILALLCRCTLCGLLIDAALEDADEDAKKNKQEQRRQLWRDKRRLDDDEEIASILDLSLTVSGSDCETGTDLSTITQPTNAPARNPSRMPQPGSRESLDGAVARGAKAAALDSRMTKLKPPRRKVKERGNGRRGSSREELDDENIRLRARISELEFM